MLPRSLPAALRWILPVLALLYGCGARSELPVCERGESRPCASICGPGRELCVQGQWEECDAPLPQGSLPIPATLRDFRIDHPDFEEAAIGLDLGMVQPTLGDDGKPVYAGDPVTPTTTGQADFDQWFRDTPGVNQSTPFTVELTALAEDSAIYSFDAPDFFPIDGQLFGNEGNAHNFHFTLEMVVDFRYAGGETFTFRGDDDMFAFINDRLAIDLGGVHSPESRTVDLDAQAATLGITPGSVYPLALFFAERHTDGSSFRVETTIAELDVCP